MDWHEFHGDHAEISSFFTHLTSNPNSKVLLSSRPIIACVKAFKECPRLCLQDLTRNDIGNYVEDTIGRHKSMQQLLSKNPKGALDLQELIVSKASGVFLWVRLAVKSILDGFGNYDRLSDLGSRIDEYPAELESLSLHMFQSLDIRYRSHAAQLSRMMHQSIAVQEKSPLTVLQISFADEIKAPSRHMTLQEREVRCDSMEGRVRSRCLRAFGGCLQGLRPHELGNPEDPSHV